MFGKNQLKFLFLAAFFAFASTPGFAKVHAKHPPAPSSAPTTPVPTSAVPQRIKTIFDYKEDLGLSQTQITTLADALDSFQRLMIEDRAKLEIANLDVQKLVNDRGDIAAIKAKMLESATIQIDMRVADLETSRKIEDTLTPQQLSKWRKIQSKTK